MITTLIKIQNKDKLKLKLGLNKMNEMGVPGAGYPKHSLRLATLIRLYGRVQ